MKSIKTRQKVSGIKVLDKPANLSKRMRDAFVRTRERAEETQTPRHDSPAEYAADNIQATAQSAARGIARNPAIPLQKASENWNRAKSRFREVRRNLPKERRAAAEQAKNVAVKTRSNADKLQKVADKAGGTSKDAKTAVRDAKRTLKKVRQDGRQTLREVRQSARTELSGKTAAKPDKPTIDKPMRNAANPGKPINAPNGGSAVRADLPVGDASAIGGGSRPSYMNGRVRPGKSASGAAKPTPATAKTAKSTARTSKETAKGAVKTAKKSVKTAGRSAKAAVKTAKQTAKAARNSAKVAAKTAKTAGRTARAASKTAARSAKAATKAVTAAVRAAIAAVKGLVAAVAAGGWIAVLIILIVCLIGLLVGSVFGIFFSGEPSTGGGKTINGVIREIDGEYQAQIDGIISGNAYDLLDMSGARAAWKEVLAVYTVRTVADPDNPMEVATIDDSKAEILRSVFWEMNAITHSIETADVEEDVLDGAGNPTGATVTATKTVLRIIVACKTSEETAAQYGFSDEQREWLAELLKPASAGKTRLMLTYAAFGTVLAAASVFLPNMFLLLAITLIGTLSIALSCYEGGVLKLCFVSVAFCVLAVISEVAASGVVSLLLSAGTPELSGFGELRAIAVSLSLLLLLMLVRISALVMQKRDTSYQRMRHIVPLLLCQAISIASAASVYASAHTESAGLPPPAMFQIAALLFLNFIVCWYFDRISYSYQLRYERDMAEIKLDWQMKYYGLVRRQLEESSAVRHDIQKHISVMTAISGNDAGGNAREYLEQWAKSTDGFPLSAVTPDAAVNAMLIDGWRRAKERGIDVRQDIIIDGDLNIPAPDLTAVLVNTIDNAIEALGHVGEGERVLEIAMKQSDKFLFYEIINTYRPAHGSAPEKKPGRGYGLKNVSAVAEKYGGTFSASADGGKYRVTVILPLRARQASAEAS